MNIKEFITILSQFPKEAEVFAELELPNSEGQKLPLTAEKIVKGRHPPSVEAICDPYVVLCIGRITSDTQVVSYDEF